MEGVEGLYKKFGVLADAKDKAGEYEEEYLSILSTISNGSDAEKRLCASFIPRFFKSFPNHQEAAFNAQLDLCEEEEAVIRREAIKGLPDLCKADVKLVARMSSVLSQLLPIEGHLDQTIVKHCLVQLLKQDSTEAVNGIVNQIISGNGPVRESARKFFLERLADSDKYLPSLADDDKLKTFIIEQLELISRGGTYQEFVEFMQVAGGIDRRKTTKSIIKMLQLDQPFDPTDTEGIERFSMLLPVCLKHFTKTTSTSPIMQYYKTVLPLFNKVDSEHHKVMLLQGLAETVHTALTTEDATQLLEELYGLLESYLPETVPLDDEIPEPPSLNFSALECLLYILNIAASQVPSFLKEESRKAELTPKLQFVLRCCTCFAKRLKGSSIGDDTPEQVKLKTKAYKTCNNTKELARGLVSSPISYKTDTNFSWKVDLSNVTNRLFSPLVSDSKRSVPPSKSRHSPTPKRRRPSDGARRAQQVYAPPQGRYSSNISGANGKDEAKRDRKRY